MSNLSGGKTLFLNRKNAILCSERLSVGGMTGTVIDVRLVLKSALEKYAAVAEDATRKSHYPGLCAGRPSGDVWQVAAS